MPRDTVEQGITRLTYFMQGVNKIQNYRITKERSQANGKVT